MARSVANTPPLAVSNPDGTKVGFSTDGATPVATSNGFSVTVTPTVGTAAYISGDTIGGIITFASAAGVSGRPVVIDSITVTDKSHQSIPFTIQFFKATPASGTYTDGSPLVYGSGDAANFTGQVRVLPNDWVNYPATITYGFLSVNDLGLVTPITATSLFALIVADVGSSTTLTASDWIITITGRRL